MIYDSKQNTTGAQSKNADIVSFLIHVLSGNL